MHYNKQTDLISDPKPPCRPSGIINVVDNESLSILCELSFAGEVSSITEWFAKGSVVESEKVDTSIIIFREWDHIAIIRSWLNHQVNSSDNGAEFMFKTTFSHRNNAHETVVTRKFTVSVLCEYYYVFLMPNTICISISFSTKNSLDM